MREQRRPINGVLSKRIIDLALVDTFEVNKGKTAFDWPWWESYLDANTRVDLELLKEDYPNQSVRNPIWDYGFIPLTTINYDLIVPENDVERWIVDRNTAKLNKDYKESDRLRAYIIAHFYEVNDLKNGTNWIRQQPPTECIKLKEYEKQENFIGPTQPWGQITKSYRRVFTGDFREEIWVREIR